MPNQRKKVAILFEGPQLGGIGKVSLDMGKVYLSLGYDVDLIVDTIIGPRKSQIPEMCKIFDLKNKRKIRKFIRVFKILKVAKADFILVSGIWSGVYVSAMQFILRSDTKVGVFCHIDPNLKELSKGPWLIRSVILHFSSLTLRKNAQIFCFSDAAKKNISKAFKLGSNVVHKEVNPVVSPLEMASEKGNEFYDWWSAGSIRLLTVSRLEKDKCVDQVIEAIKELKEDVRLLVIGDGPEYNSLQNLIKKLQLKNVKLAKSRIDPSPYFRDAHILVHASRRESFGLVIAEALCSGLQVVATDCDFGPREILGNDFPGLVKVGDCHALTQKISSVINNPVPKAKILQLANRFSADAVCARYLSSLRA